MNWISGNPETDHILKGVWTKVHAPFYYVTICASSLSRSNEMNILRCQILNKISIEIACNYSIIQLFLTNQNLNPETYLLTDFSLLFR